MTTSPYAGMLTLPAELERAIAAALAAAPSPRWLRAATELSERYRAPRERHDRPLATGPDDALGYAALILPAAYAQLSGALAAAAARIPGWSPATLLDLGSGPGTALWAAAARWPELRAMVAVEREPAFLTLGRGLATHSAHPALRAAAWERRDLREPPPPGRHDLVILGHVLNEIDPASRERVVAAAWERTAGLLLIVEPGTSAAFPVVRAARDQLLAAGARTIAPCTHDAPCPLTDDWCHFPERLRRPPFQRRARDAPSAWEDAKYCYAAMARFPPDLPIWGRVIREPTSNKAYAEALLSTKAGIIRQRALKRHREAFRRVKGLRWGEAIEEPIGE